MNAASPTVSAMVLNYVNYEETILCVRDLLLQDYTNLDVVVIDNYSPNGSLEKLTEAFGEHPRVTIKETGENLGYARGNNFGVRWRFLQAPIDYLLVANNDVRIPDETTITQLVAFAEGKADLAALAPKVVLPSGFIQGPYARPNVGILSLQYLFPPFWYALRWWRQRRLKKRHHPQRCYRTIGAFILLKARLFKEVGMFDEHTFMGAEEDILAERFRRTGFSFYYFPAVFVVHNHSRSATSMTGRDIEGFWIGLESLAYYFKHYRGVRNILVRFFLASAAIYGKWFFSLRRRSRL